MIKENNSTQQKLEMVYIENLVPKDHLLRNIDKYIDFSFIRNLTKDLYCLDNSLSGLDTIVLFKMLFIGYLYGIRSLQKYPKVRFRQVLSYSYEMKRKLEEGSIDLCISSLFIEGSDIVNIPLFSLYYIK